MWQSPDPILHEYMSGQTNGGVFNPKNLSLFTYTYNNPVNLVDPDGEAVKLAVSAGKIVYKAYKQYQKTGQINTTSLKKIGGDELADIAGDLYTIFGDSSASTFDKVKAGIDLVSGLETNNKGQDVVKEVAEKIVTKASSLQQKVKRGQAPKDIERFDSANTGVKKSQDHVHFKDGTSMNMDGTIHDKMGGTPNPTSKTKKFLGKENWPTEITENK